jgi:cob(I)alamin adenosyltransferase
MAVAKTSGSKGLLLVYTGEGKGKTTAALGAVFRALGRGWKPAVVQFIKGKRPTGERQFAETLPGLVFKVMGRGFTWESDDLSRDRQASREAWEEAERLIGSGGHELVVLDELSYVVNYGFIPVEAVTACLRARPAGGHVIVTGRRMPDPICELADLVTEMRKVKHPYDQGISAQPGIDF